MSTLPTIPDSAPFTQEQRFWLNGYIAAMVSDGSGESASSQTTVSKLRVPLIFASQSGNAEGLAEGFAEQLSIAGFESPCLCASDFADLDLTKEKFLLIVSSTWGEGDPPDNAVDFWNALQADDHPRLEGLTFGVLALGDSNYLDFCKQGRLFDERLEALGATRLVARVDCDTDFEEPAEAWFETVRTALAEKQGSDLPASSAATEKLDSAEPKWSKKNPFPARLLMNRRLNGETSARDTRHFEIDLAGSGLTYEVGDVLGVYGHNHPQAVDELIALLAFDSDAPVTVSDGIEVTLRQALIEHYDIRTINKPLLEAWAQVSSSSSLGKLLADESNSAAIEEYLWGREIIDLVAEHRPRFSAPGDFLALLRKLGPRLYSISSSPKAHPDEVHLTIARVGYEAHGRKRYGVCSTFLADRVYPEGEVKVFLQQAKHFKLPEDTARPVIMVGPGTGIAPFRAFLEERQATAATGPNWLFFGNPHEAEDFLYQEQFRQMQEQGILTRLDTAWSRDQEEKIYVQDRMIEAGAELWKWLQEGAHFYVCGDAKRMAKDVDDALHAVIAEHGGMSQTDAAAYVSEMKKAKRYQRDVY